MEDRRVTIGDVLADMSGGRTMVEFEDRFRELIEAVENTGKTGSLTLTLKVKPDGDRQVLITDEIKAKVPQLQRGMSIFFTTRDHMVTREDPCQMTLPFKDVSQTAGNVTELRQARES